MQDASGGATDRPSGNRPRGPALKLRFAGADDVRHFADERLRAGAPISLQIRRGLPHGLVVQIVFSVAGCAGTLSLGGQVSRGSTASNAAAPTVEITLEDPAGALASVTSYVDYVESFRHISTRSPVERRKTARLTVTVPVWLRFAPRPGEPFHDFYTKDLSRTGLFVYVESLPALETPVEVLLVSPQRERGFALRGEVVRTVPGTDRNLPGVGIHFGPLQLEAQAHLDSYLKGLASAANAGAGARTWTGAPRAIGTIQPKVSAPTVPSMPPAAAAERLAIPTPQPFARIQARARVLLRPPTAKRLHDFFNNELRHGLVLVRAERAATPGTPVDLMLVLPDGDESYAFEGDVERFEPASGHGERGGTVAIRLPPLVPALALALQAICERLLAAEREGSAQAHAPLPQPPRVSVVRATAGEQ